ncbi:YqzE family protein [Cohnella fermenti]|uniref:YqzE family protein n=1 Tax=Cohnella fermenti TaxID=2565925 RepID=A0A4S4BPD6_9BACL|nr:YqzE family protein [Cohnella fermenti]THF76591.1 YqzE family protein [Cohnella fermenti]
MANEGRELVKAMAKRMETILTTTAEEREPERQRKRSRRLPWYAQLFGTLLPMGMHLWWLERRKNKPHYPGS